MLVALAYHVVCGPLGRRPRIIYVESFARTRTLSRTGHLMRLLADRFLVQWPSLRRGRSRILPLAPCEYHGILV